MSETNAQPTELISSTIGNYFEITIIDIIKKVMHQDCYIFLSIFSPEIDIFLYRLKFHHCLDHKSTKNTNRQKLPRHATDSYSTNSDFYQILGFATRLVGSSIFIIIILLLLIFILIIY